MIDGLEEKTPSQTTIEELEQLCATAFGHDKLSDEFEAKAKEEREKRDGISAKIKSILDHYQKSKFDSNYGTIEIRKKQSYKTPKTPEEKKAFFEYLQSKGILWNYATVNANALNAFANEEREALISDGKDGKIPGLEDPKEYQTIAYRSKK